MAVALAIAFILAGLYALANPFAGLLGLLAADIIRPGELYPSIAFLHVERVLTIIILMSILHHRQRLEWPSITNSILIFWGTMFLSVPLAIWKSDALANAFEFGRIILYHILVLNLVRTEKKFRVFLLTFTLLIGWLAGSSLYAFSHGMHYNGTESVERIEALNSFGGNPNLLGSTIIVSLPLILLLLPKGSSVARLTSIGVTVLGITAVIFTGSRTSYLSLLFLVCAAALLRKGRFIYLPAAGLLVLFIWTVTPTNYQKRYLSVENRDRDVSYQLRLKAWQAGWAMFKDNPITGIGVGEFGIADGMMYWPDPTHRRWFNSHSLYVQVVAELGLLGTIAFAVFLIGFFRLNRKLSQHLAENPGSPPWLRFFPFACNMSLLALLFEGYAGHDLYRSSWYMMAGLAGALQLLLAEQSREPAAIAVHARTLRNGKLQWNS